MDHSSDLPRAPARRMRLAIFAAPLSGNKGSASMVWGLLDLLRDQGFQVEAVVYSYYPRRDRRIAQGREDIAVEAGHPWHLLGLTLGLIAARLLPGGASWRGYGRLASCDAACLMGGTTFNDAKLYKVPWNLLAALPAYIVGLPVLFLSQTLGPFRRRLNRLPARWTLSRARHVYGRGPLSAEQARALGIRDAAFQPDLSFGMRVGDGEAPAEVEAWFARIERLRANAAGDGPRPLAGITPNTIVDAAMRGSGGDYVGLLSALVLELDHRGYAPVVIPHSYLGEGRGRHNNDLDLCRALLQQVPAHVPCLLIDADLSSVELRRLVGRLDLLVASRFHSMISALAMGTPCITIGWGGHKYSEVLSTYGLEDGYIHYDNASLHAVRERLDWVEANRERIRQDMASGNARNLELLRDLGQTLEASARAR